MSRKNFKDPVTGEEFVITSFSTIFVNGEKVYKDNYRKELCNPKTGNKLVYIDRPPSDFGMPMVAKFNPTSIEGQKQIKQYFGERSKKFDTKGAGKDEKDQKVKDFKSQIIERAKDGKL